MGHRRGRWRRSSAELTPLLGARASKQLVENVVVTLLGRLVDQSRLERRDTAQSVGKPNQDHRKKPQRARPPQKKDVRAQEGLEVEEQVAVVIEVWSAQR